MLRPVSLCPGAIWLRVPQPDTRGPCGRVMIAFQVDRFAGQVIMRHTRWIADAAITDSSSTIRAAGRIDWAAGRQTFGDVHARLRRISKSLFMTITVYHSTLFKCPFLSQCRGDVGDDDLLTRDVQLW